MWPGETSYLTINPSSIRPHHRLDRSRDYVVCLRSFYAEAAYILRLLLYTHTDLSDKTDERKRGREERERERERERREREREREI